MGKIDDFDVCIDTQHRDRLVHPLIRLDLECVMMYSYEFCRGNLD